jgi:putative transposase
MVFFKREEAGRRIVAVDPRCTSQTRPCCGYKKAQNRPSQAEFKRLHCGFEANADFVAFGKRVDSDRAVRRRRRDFLSCVA